MVLAERTSDNLRNGRRSRGPSPNGNASESSGDEVDGVPEEKIRVGRDFQAVVPELIPIENRRPDQCIDRALLVWSPSITIPDTNLDEYISLAKEKYGYNGEQALGMLFWHKHNLERAIRDLANFTPFPDEWTVEDKVLFEQAFQFHGKSFHRIRQMLPEMTIACLVKYYYSWKKTRTRTSLMDRQARKLASHRDEGSEGGSEHGSNTDSDSEEKVKLPGEKSSASGNDTVTKKDTATRKGFLLPNSNKTNQAKLVSDRNMKNLHVSNWDGKNVGNSSLSEVLKRKESALNVGSQDLVTSPSKRRLLSMPAPKSVKLNRAAMRKTLLNNSPGLKHESSSYVDVTPTTNTAGDSIKPAIEIAAPI